MKYWVYMNGEVPGSYAPGELAALPGFSNTTLVCPAEGEILEKNWRRSGEFDDLIKAMTERDSKLPPPERRTRDAAAAAAATDVNQLLDTTSSRLFTHVSSLMKELENRREERALTTSLQRQLVELTAELKGLREKSAVAEAKLPRITELEESVRRNALQIESLESSLKAREEGMSELRAQLEKTRMEHENSKRRLGEALNDLAIRNRLVDKLSRDLTEKELSLAKSLAVIRRLEEELNRIAALPLDVAPEAAAAADASPVVEEPRASDAFSIPAAPIPEAPSPVVEEAQAPEVHVTSDEPVPPPLPEPVHEDQPKAQDALIAKFRGLFGRLDH